MLLYRKAKMPLGISMEGWQSFLSMRVELNEKTTRRPLEEVMVLKFITIEFFTNSPQYKNANIANFILAVQLGIV